MNRDTHPKHCVIIRNFRIMKSFYWLLSFKSDNMSEKLSCGVSFKRRTKGDIVIQQPCLKMNYEKLFWGKRVKEY